MMKNYPDYELSAQDAELLSAYVDDMLDKSERLAFEQRLADDATLQAELVAWQATISLINTLPQMIAPRDFTLTPDMLERFDDDAISPDISEPKLKIIPRKRKPRTNWLPVLSAAAVILVAFGFFAVFISNDNAQISQPASESVAYSVTQAGIVDERTIQNMSIDPLPTLESTEDQNTQAYGVEQSTFTATDESNADAPVGGLDLDREVPPAAPAIVLATTAPGLDNSGVAADSMPQTVVTVDAVTDSESNTTANTNDSEAVSEIAVEEEAAEEDSNDDFAGTMADDADDMDTSEAPAPVAATGFVSPDEAVAMAESDESADTAFFEPEAIIEDGDIPTDIVAGALADEPSAEELFNADVQLQTTRSQPVLPALNTAQTRIITAISQIVATLIVLSGAG